MESKSYPPARRSAAAWAILACLAIVLPVSLDSLAQQPPRPKARTVRLIIDYGDGVEKHFTRLKWAEGLTVQAAMQAAAEGPRPITFEHKGQGETAFATRIDDLENQGGGRGKKNWLYSVNEEQADRSFGVYELRPSDVVRWEFREYQPGK